MNAKEKIYDEEIAPLQLEVSKKCQAAEIPFIAAAFYSWHTEDQAQSWGETAFIPKDCQSAHIRTVQAAVKANGNADSLIWWMMRHGKEHGHNSACLSILDSQRRMDQ